MGDGEIRERRVCAAQWAERALEISLTRHTNDLPRAGGSWLYGTYIFLDLFLCFPD